jgi:hypothetical protein
MSLALAHFAVGAAVTTLLVTFLVPTVRYPRTLALVGGGWAMLPDLHQVSPVAVAPLRAFHGSPWADLFWFHRTLDRLDPTDSALLAALFVGGFLLVTAVAERRSYRAPARVVQAYETYVGPTKE